MSPVFPASSDGVSLPLQTTADPQTVVENAVGNPILATDGNGQPVLHSSGSNGAYGFDGSNNPVIKGADNATAFNIDAQGNPQLKSETGQIIGFDPSGNPAINAVFRIPRVVGRVTFNLTAGPTASPLAGGTVRVVVNVTGAIVGDDVFVTVDDGTFTPTLLGNVVIGSTGIPSSDNIFFNLVNTDNVNAGNNLSGNAYITVQR